MAHDTRGIEHDSAVQTIKHHRVNDQTGNETSGYKHLSTTGMHFQVGVFSQPVNVDQPPGAKPDSLQCLTLLSSAIASGDPP